VSSTSSRERAHRSLIRAVSLFGDVGLTEAVGAGMVSAIVEKEGLVGIAVEV
jgi:hypothetical protein